MLIIIPIKPIPSGEIPKNQYWIATGILEGRASRASISTADSGTPAEISQAAPTPAESEPEMESDSADNEVTDTPATPE